jgi:flagellar protein FliS
VNDLLNSPYQIYQQSSVQTANRGKLLIMLYEGAIRFTKTGIEGMHKHNHESTNTNLKKAQAIVHELIASLDQSYDISKDLLSIYEYMLHLLIESNLKKNPTLAEEALGYLVELHEAWKQAVNVPFNKVSEETNMV